MIAADIIRALLIASVPAAYALGLLTLVQLYVVAFAAGSVSVAFSIAINSLFASMVPRERIVPGTSLVRGSYSFSFAAGPGLGGVLVQLLSGPVALILDVISFLFSAGLLRSISLTEPPAQPAGRGHLRDGMRFVLRTPILMAKLLGDAAMNFFYTLYFTLLLLYGTRQLGLSAGIVGLVIAAGAIGALASLPLSGSVNRLLGISPAFFAGSFLYLGALVLVPLASGPRWVEAVMLIAAEFISGLGLMICDISSSAIQQAITPDRFRARVQSAMLLFNNGSDPSAFCSLARSEHGSEYGKPSGSPSSAESRVSRCFSSHR